MAQVGTIKESFAELSDIFHSRMAEFQRDLDKAGPGNTSASSVESDFSAFKSFILKALDMLQKQVEHVTQQVDQMEMRTRRKMLVIHGVKGSTSATGSEDTTGLVTEKLRTIKSSFSAADISRCHRLGKARGNKPPPILVKLRDVTIRDELWFGKVALKGSGVTMGEFLTKPRHELFVAARDRFGVRNCWSWNGDVFVLDASKVRHRVSSVVQLKTISVPAKSPAAPTPAALTPAASAPAATTSTVPSPIVEEHAEDVVQPTRRPKRVPKSQS